MRKLSQDEMCLVSGGDTLLGPDILYQINGPNDIEAGITISSQPTAGQLPYPLPGECSAGTLVATTVAGAAGGYLGALGGAVGATVGCAVALNEAHGKYATP